MKQQTYQPRTQNKQNQHYHHQHNITNQQYRQDQQAHQYGQRQQAQQYNQNQNQKVMSKPPAVLTTKDMMYLKDAMSWELLAMKKCNHFAQECKSSEIKHTINKAGKMHEHHYKMLLEHVNPNKVMTNNQ